NSILTSYNAFRPIGGVSGYVPFTGGNQSIYLKGILSGQNFVLNFPNATIDAAGLTGGAAQLIDFGNGFLLDYGNLSVDWFDGSLIEPGGAISVDWTNRQLYNQS